MKTFTQIVEDIKDVLCENTGNRNKAGLVFDKDVAAEIGVSCGALATQKARNVIPYEELAIWCASKKIAINTLLFDQAAESLIVPTNVMFMNRYHLAH